MYSKLRVILTLALLGTLVACGLHLGEKAPRADSISYSGNGYGCVGEIPQTLESYVNDIMSPEQITSFTRCLQKALTSFGELTRGRSANVYQPDEIRRFLQGYFLKDRVMNDELMNQFMLVKQILVGGETTTITRPELLDIITFLEEARREAIHLKPYLKYLNFSLVANQEPKNLGAHLEEAYVALRSTIDVLAVRLAKSKQSYALGDLASLITEFRQFVDWDGHFKKSHPVPDWISFLQIFKELTISPVNSHTIAVGEWVPLLQSISRWYLGFLEYEVGVKNKPLLQGTGLQNLDYLAHEFFDLSDQAVRRQPGQTITFDQLARLTSALHELGWISGKLRISSITQTIRASITRIFGDLLTPASDRKSEGLTPFNVATMRSEFERWVNVQLNLDNHFAGGQTQDVPSLQAPLTLLTPDIRDKLNSLQGSDWDEFLKVKANLRPLFAENENLVYLLPAWELESRNVRHGFYNLSMMNMLRSMVALIFRGYAEHDPGGSEWARGITGPELERFYEDFRDLGIDLTIVDRRNERAGLRAFVEGKLFTYESNGLHSEKTGLASELSFTQAMAHFAFLYSGGQVADHIFDQLLKQCENGPLDINGLPMVSRECTLESMPALQLKFLPNMPHLLDYLNRLRDPVKLRAYSQTILDTAYNSNSNPQWFEHNEMSTLGVILHYTEAVMTRYDTNPQDGILNNFELADAEPIFHDFIKGLAIADSSLPSWMTRDFMVNDAFFFILDKGRLPAGWDKAKIDRYRFANPITIEKHSFYSPTLQVDRLDLANVFKVIIQKMFEVKTPTPAAAAVTIPCYEDPMGATQPTCAGPDAGGQ